MSKLRNGQVISERFQILSFLGQGSFSQVYLASDNRWRGNLVALKEIATGHFSDHEYAHFNAHFLQEAAFLMRLQHPGLPRVIEFFAEGQNYYLALEWVPGHTLEQEVQQRDLVPESEVLDWGLQLLEVLTYLHNQKPYPVLMGDLKPSNIVIDYNAKLRVIDFGVAGYAVPGQRRRYAMVTPGFSPPEQYQSESPDERCDLYAWAATLYWCLHPVALEKFRFDFPSIRRFRSDISSTLDGLLQRALQRDPATRFQDANQMGKILRDSRERAEAPAPSDILSALYRDHKKKFDF